MGAKNCPETPRQKMINMMYIVLTAMLALNVAAEVLQAFRVVDSSLTQTLKTVDLKNTQMYSSFDQAYAENATKVGNWKEKADQVKAKTDALISDIWKLKQDLVKASGGAKIGGSIKLRPDDPSFINELTGDTFKIKKEDDLNTPSEMMITQNKANELKKKIIAYKEFLTGMISDDNAQLKETIIQELDTSDPPAKTREGGEKLSWEVQLFDSKPLIAVNTMLSKIQLDIRNAESHMISYLYSQIDAGSFKFNKLGARVLASGVVLQGDEYVAEIFLSAEDTTQNPEIYVNNQKLQLTGGKGIYRPSTSTTGTFKFSGVIKYKTPSGIFQSYPFEQSYQVTAPAVNISATGMNVFYHGIRNPIDISVGALAKENLRPEMTNGHIEKDGNNFYVVTDGLDELGKKTTITVYATIGGTERNMGLKPFRVKRVPDPEAQVAGISGGDIQKSRLQIEDGISATLKDFDFDFKYTVTQFTVNITNSLGYTNPFVSNSNRFTKEQKDQFGKLNPGMIIYIDNIKARGDDNSVRPLKPVSFKIQ